MGWGGEAPRQGASAARSPADPSARGEAPGAAGIARALRRTPRPRRPGGDAAVAMDDTMDDGEPPPHTQIPAGHDDGGGSSWGRSG